jgi:hypothetical protein
MLRTFNNSKFKLLNYGSCRLQKKGKMKERQRDYKEKPEKQREKRDW